MYKSISFISALVLSVAVAQMPKECFFVNELHGNFQEVNSEAKLLSDLPKLMASFKPGMRLDLVKGYSFADSHGKENQLTGLEVHLTDGKPYFGKKLELSLIGNALQGESGTT